MRRHASSGLQSVLDQGIQTAQTHHQHAKTLKKTIEGSTATTTDHSTAAKSKQ